MKRKGSVVVLALGSCMLLSGLALAGPGKRAPTQAQAASKPAHNAAQKNAAPKEGKWAREKGTCEGLNSKAKELEAQEKQLLAQAKEKEIEEKSLIAQASAIERQRVGEEHGMKGSANKKGTEAELKAQEQQRVNLEHQAEEKMHERKELIRQADELGKQRREVEAQHKQDCTFGKGKHSN